MKKSQSKCKNDFNLLQFHIDQQHCLLYNIILLYYCFVKTLSVGQSKETEFRVRNLTENSMYRFRVCAHTMDGQGHWTELDKDVTAADPYGESSSFYPLGYQKYKFCNILMFNLLVLFLSH